VFCIYSKNGCAPYIAVIKVHKDVTVEQDRICTLYTKYVLVTIELSSKRHSFWLLYQFMTALGRADDPSWCVHKVWRPELCILHFTNM